jgi:hypothetical protein
VGTVARLLDEHVSFRCTSVDRIGVGGYIPGLMCAGGVVRFLLGRGYRIPSPAGLGHNHDRLVRELDRFVAERGLPVVRFRRGQSKERIARPYQDAAARDGRAGVVLVGKAQERVAVWRGFVDDTSPQHSAKHPHFRYARQSAVPDAWYFYLWDEQWGPAMVKLVPYAPYPVWVSCNGHHWARRQLQQAGIGFTAVDNALLDCEDPAAVTRICARLSAGHLHTAVLRWLSWLPSPLQPTDRAGGFRYEFSLRQLEISDTAVFDRPRAGRALFEAAIRDHLDLGRPDRVSLVFDRRIHTRGKNQTPGRFATTVITRGVNPQIDIRYKSDAVKAYFKHDRALRVETTINNPDDFGVRRRLTIDTWRRLRRIGEQVNARFLAALGEGEHRLPDPTTLQQVVLPSDHDGLRAPGLRFGDPRVMALLASIASFTHVVGGVTNAGLRRLMTGLFDPAYTARQAGYDLTRLRRKGFIQRVPGSRSYQITTQGRQLATFFTTLGARIVVPTLTDLAAQPRPRAPAPRPLTTAWRSYERELDRMITHAHLAA